MVRPDWRPLESSLAGEVLLPSSPGYDAARRPANPRFDGVRPLAVVRCAAPDDVVAALAFVRRNRLPLAVRSGGHCMAGRSSTQGVLIDVGPMNSVAVHDGLAVVGAGTRLAGLYDGLASHGVTVPAGCGPTVGIAGLALGGGLGILGRAYGLTADRLRAARVVLADGRIVDCDAHREPDLFWALRGGGGAGLGVVTSLSFEPVPAPVMTRFRLAWPVRHAASVTEAWQAWAPTAADEVAASLRLQAPGHPGGTLTVVVSGAMMATGADATTQLDRFVAGAGADPTSVETAEAPYAETKRRLAERDAGRQASHEAIKSAFFGQPLPASVIASLVSHLVENPAPGIERLLDFSPWGGAYNRTRPDATAFVHRDERFLLQYAAVVDVDADPQTKASAQHWVRRAFDLGRPSASPGVYQNFPDPELDDPARAYYGANHLRLRRVKAAYDPETVFPTI